MSGHHFRVFMGTSAMLLSIVGLGGCPQSNNAAENGAQGAQDSVTAVTNNGSNASDSTTSDGGTSTSVSETGQPADSSNASDAGDNPVTPVVGDYDGDLKVSESDIRLLSRSFGSNLVGGDLNADTRIDILDLAILLTLVQN